MHDGFRNNYSVINCGGHLREKGKNKKKDVGIEKRGKKKTQQVSKKS